VRRKPTLLFISPQFLFPLDAGGKIRSANILKQMKGGAFETRLLMPATSGEEARWRTDVAALADEVALWRPSARNALWRARRAVGFLSPIPISAQADADAPARRAVGAALARAPDLVVFDYVQSLAMAPKRLASKSLFFAHNVETEILQRHAGVASGVMKPVWSREAAKMRRFERAACKRTGSVIAVSERDADIFRSEFGAANAFAIPTGVDPGYFSYSPAPAPAPAGGPARVVFTGSMDWKANQDGLSWFMNEVWPLIAAARPDASFAAIGKNPPRAMVEAAAAKRFNWRFTGFVDDVRDHARGEAYVIPLRVGGGTRIKAYEAMAMGVPVVSTALGVEGLPVTPGEHFLLADDARGFAAAVVRLLAEPALGARLAGAARRLVEENFSHAAAARVFERHCLAVLGAAR
jgi:glycosyltransferase involved in cell wall biosynthesis